MSGTMDVRSVEKFTLAAHCAGEIIGAELELVDAVQR